MGEEKEEKPKKMFIVQHVIWDDGEIDTEIYHFKKSGTGRGAPGKWRLKPDDFKQVFEDTLGQFDMIVDDMNKGLGLNTIVQNKNISAPTVETKPVDTVVEKPKKESKKKKEVSDDLGDEDIDFGEFGKDSDSSK